MRVHRKQRAGAQVCAGVLFDLGYLTVTLDYRVEVSMRIREEFENGRHYYALHGQSLAVLPRHEGSLPAPEFLRWHHEIFKR